MNAYQMPAPTQRYSLETLRQKHPTFIYESYDALCENQVLKVQFNFLLDGGAGEGSIEFHPQIEIPCNCSKLGPELRQLIFHQGLVEMLSYWKSACPPRILIKAGTLSPAQIMFWLDLFRNGMGEFYYRNNIDFSEGDFLKLECEHEPNQDIPLASATGKGDLLLVAGGKDSSVMLELLRGLPRRKAAFILYPLRASIDSARIAGYQEVLLAKRSIDPQLLKLNRQGYLNGHTPFSACLAFLSLLTAAANGFDHLIVANESSASEANVSFHGMEINHQYSKSLRFEQMFRDYCRNYLSRDIEYFSFFRPLCELQISRLMSNYESHLFSFRSCNVNQKKDSWCGECPKCTFVYLCLFPFAAHEILLNVFGQDLFEKECVQEHLRALLGLGAIKPFDCVGTRAESEAALLLSLEKYATLGKPVPSALAELGERVRARGLQWENPAVILRSWDSRHFLPPEYEAILKEALGF